MNLHFLFQVLPHDIKFYRGGTELLNRIESMSAKVNLFRAEQKLQQSNGGIGTMTRTEDSLLPSAAPSEVKGLLTGTKNIIKEKLPSSLVVKSKVNRDWYAHNPNSSHVLHFIF